MRAPHLLLLVIVAGFAVGALSACSSAPAGFAEARSDKERVTNPDVTAAQLDALVSGNNAFAVELYKTLLAQDASAGNALFSPYSISAALAMTYAGARGTTEAEMQDVLHFSSQDELHPAFDALDLSLTSPRERRAGGDPLTLTVANSVWGQQGFEFLAPFLDALAQYYDAGLRLVDFENEAEAAREAINDWVAERTEQKIKDLIPPGAIDTLTRLVLANAIYFKGSWAEPFDPAETSDGTFHRLDGTDVQVPMMHVDLRTGYARQDGLQAVRLPYAGGAAEMVVLLPDAGSFDAFEASLSPDSLSSALSRFEDYSVNLTMPKFGFDSDFSLREGLTGMGMETAFDPSPGVADFSGMDGARDLYIQDVVHKATITVNEEGTEAAAATGVIIGLSSGPAGPVDVTVDRPFIFLIRDTSTGAILFMGRVLDPSS